MKCKRCESEEVLKNGSSRHGRQCWLCPGCGKTSGGKDHWRVEPAKRASALAAQLEEVEWIEAYEIWTYIGQKNSLLVVMGY